MPSEVTYSVISFSYDEWNKENVYKCKAYGPYGYSSVCFVSESELF